MIPAARDNPFGRYWRQKADQRWSLLIRQAGYCALCGRRNDLEAHHLIGRSRLALRHRIECGLCLCRFHHQLGPRISPHLAPKAFEAWLERAYPEQYHWVQDHRTRPSLEKVDFRQVYLDLLKPVSMNF